MITEHDLQEAIAECEGVRNPNASVCTKLAAFYTIRDHLYSQGADQESNEPVISYSRSSEPDVVNYYGESDFARVVGRMNVEDVLGIMDELMQTLRAIMPRLYDGVMRKLKSVE